MLLCCVTFINFFFYSFALSTERTWFDYISLLIIPCIIYYVTNKETLNLEGYFKYIITHIYEMLNNEMENKWTMKTNTINNIKNEKER